MTWLKKNWLWLAVNIIAVLTLAGMLSMFSVDFTEGSPTITVEAPDFRGKPGEESSTADMPAENNPGETGEREESSPFSFLVHTTGEWAIRWLVISLTATPLYILFGWRSMLSIKKVTGLYAFLFSVLHLLFFAADEGWLATFDEFNFILGLISLLIMLPLAFTSNQWSMKRLGKNWKILHRTAYAAGMLAVLHLVFLGEGSWVLYGIILSIGFVARIPQVRKTVTGFRQKRLNRSLVPA